MHNTFTLTKARLFICLFSTFILATGLLFSNPAAYAENTVAREPILVTGHSNPDTDSTASAIALSHLLNQLGKSAVPMTQGPLNPETKYVLERFSVPAPELVGNVANRNIAIVDFTDTPQAPAGFDKANLVFIADHHKLGNVTSSSPLEAWILPYGSTATVLYQVYTYYGIPVPKDIAGIMLGAILSDTVIFRSATATDKDLESANALAKIAGVDDIAALGMKLFAIKSDISQKGSMELLQRDYKEFNMNGQKIGIAQLEMTDSTPALKRKAGFLSAMKDMKEKTHSQSVLFMLTDIMQGNTTLLVVSDNPQLIENAFSKKIVNDEMKLPGVMSRKKQLIPDLEKAFRK